MNQPDPLLHDGLPSPLQATDKPLTEILSPIDADITGNSQLDMVGIDSIVEAIAAGHTVFNICQQLGITVKTYLHWVNKLSAEDHQLLEGARTAFYENLERTCQAKMITIAKMGEEIDEDNPDMIGRLAIRDKALQTIERVLKATQHTINRQLVKEAQRPATGADVHITQMVVSNAWLAALPDE